MGEKELLASIGKISSWARQKNLIPEFRRADFESYVAIRLLENPLDNPPALWLAVDYLRVIGGRQLSDTHISKTLREDFYPSMEYLALTPSFEEELIEKIDSEGRIDSMLSSLNRAERLIINLIFVEDYIQSEVADFFEVTESAMSQRLQIIYEKIRKNCGALAIIENSVNV